jgi:hypothetical protein
MQKQVSRFQAFIGLVVLEWILSFAYVSGLTLLFPFVYFLSMPGNTSPTLLAIALGLIGFSFIGFLWLHGGFGHALKCLSKITLIPGMIGVVFSIFGQNFIFAMLPKALPAEAIEIATMYLEEAIPKIRALTIAYIVLGVFLFWLGEKFGSKKNFI